MRAECNNENEVPLSYTYMKKKTSAKRIKDTPESLAPDLWYLRKLIRTVRSIDMELGTI